jgi:hypothetical protein
MLVLVGSGALLCMFGALVLASSWTDSVLLGAAMAASRHAAAEPDWMRNLRALGVEAICEGVLLVCGGVIAVPRWRGVLRWAETTNYGLPVAATALLLIVWTPVVVFGRHTVIDGRVYWWLGDDAMISMRYARNLATGNGLVWNPGEHVEGYTNFLWTLYMAVVHLLPIASSWTALIVLVTNIVLAIATLPVLVLLVRLLGGSATAIGATLASFVLSANIQVWASYGYETALQSLLLVLAVYLVLRDARQARVTLMPYICLGLLCLVRADAAVLAGLVYAGSLALNPSKRRVIAYASLPLAMLVAQLVFRIGYYSDILPNTAYLKTTNWDGRFAAGLAYASSFLLRYMVPVLCACAGLILSTNRVGLFIGAMLLAYTGYVAYIGGDAFPDYRFFVPVIPVLMASAFVGVERLARGASHSTSRMIVLGAVCLLSIPLVLPGYAVRLFPYFADEGNVRIGVLLNKVSTSQSKVADFWAGSTLYYADRPAIDLLGKSDRVIARLPAHSSGTLPGHNKFDFAYSLGELHPDFLIAHFNLPVTDDEMRRATGGDYAYIGQLYFDPLFRAHCLDHPVPGDTWRTVFACDWNDASPSAIARER